MGVARLLCCATVTFLLVCATAQAGGVVVLEKDGSVGVRADPGVAAREQPLARTSGAATSGASTRARRSARRRTVTRELRRLRDEGAIDPVTYEAARSQYLSFKRAERRFSGRRRIEMTGVRKIVDGIAARRQLTASRITPLWLTLERNREWWNEGGLPASGQRISFEGTELVWQYVPGQGLQIHPLANFGKLNALWRSRLEADRMEALLDELLPLAAERAGGTAWEYYFEFGGGAPPWVSSLAQGTGLQAVARAAGKAGRLSEVLPLTQRGLAIFRAAPPSGVRTRGVGGIHYAQYSYAPDLRILNGFVQSLVGLFDYAAIAQDPVAQQLFVDGEASARNEVPAFDTGAWSLYSRGSITRESDLNYHGVLIDFLESLCDRTSAPVYCDAVTNFKAYLDEPPEVELVTNRVRAGRQGAIRFRLSKISRVTLRLRRGGRTVLDRTLTYGYGTKSHVIVVPRKPRASEYRVQLVATDLAGNSTSLTDSVEILKARRRST